MTDDPVTPQSSLKIGGPVAVFAAITPRVVRLNGNAGEPLKETITIVPEPEYSFSIKGIKAQRGEFIKYELSEKAGDNGVKNYQISIENTKKDAGAYYDVMVIETDSKIQPEIKINVMARLVDPNKPAPGNDGKSSGKNIDGAANNGGNSGNSGGKGNAGFVELIQQIQQQRAAGDSNSASSPPEPGSKPVQDPEKAAELKKKFEELIKQAQEKKAKEEKPAE
ncbi:hypothetical protein MTBBW1_2200037 [Desulfamplus magnetovallimortis]|nr:hypothetical protein MTBBW1_2200037 [Desulfamplus magnetovallimortis]